MDKHFTGFRGGVLSQLICNAAGATAGYLIGGDAGSAVIGTACTSLAGVFVSCSDKEATNTKMDSPKRFGIGLTGAACALTCLAPLLHR